MRQCFRVRYLEGRGEHHEKGTETNESEVALAFEDAEHIKHNQSIVPSMAWIAYSTMFPE